MALSDACYDFLQATADAAEELAKAVHHYSAPDYPIPYGVEIDALRRACLAVKQGPYDPTAVTELFRLAASVMTFHDTPPNTPESVHRQTEMKRLIDCWRSRWTARIKLAFPLWSITCWLRPPLPR